MTDKMNTGRHGEDLAAAFLENKGYTVRERNYRYRRSEIDLIVEKDGWLIFVEVKARRSTVFGDPETFVRSKKIKKILEAAEQYIFDQDWQANIRFDIVSVILGKTPQIDHFEDAFY